MPNVLITGANRGIGLALARLHAARGDRVIATCRQRSAELDASTAQVIDTIELSDPASIARLREALGEVQLQRIMLNAGVLEHESLEDLHGPDGPDAAAAIRKQFEINALAPLLLLAALCEHLAPGARIGVLTSRMGSIADNSSGSYYGYRMSKAALNAAARSLSLDLAPRKIAVFILHPGFVRTGMTGGRGEVTADESAAQLIARVDTLDAKHSGSFWHANGTPLPW